MNEWSLDSVHELYGYPMNKMFNVGFGINASFLDEDKSYDDPHLLIILRKGTEYYKGLDFLLEALKIARDFNRSIKLSVVGSEYTKVDGVTYYYNQPREVTLDLLKRA